MLLTTDHDDRVVPLHFLKLLATMQYILCKSVENSPQTNPVVGRINTKSGHGCVRPTQKVIDEAVDTYAFMASLSCGLLAELEVAAGTDIATEIVLVISMVSHTTVVMPVIIGFMPNMKSPYMWRFTCDSAVHVKHIFCV